MKNWKQVLAGLSTVALLLTNVGVSAPLSVYAEENKTELSTESGDVTLKASDSIFPGTATLKAESVTPTIEGQEILAAYNLKVEYTVIEKDENGDEILDEETKEPKTKTETYTLESGKTVTVTIKSDSLKDVEKVNVYQGDDKTAEVEVKDSAVSVTASSLNKIIAVTKDKEETPKSGTPENNSALDIASITLTDNIKNDGTIVATFEDKDGKDITDDVVAAANAGTLTIQWNGGYNRDGAVADNTPNKLNVVKDQGSQLTYYVTVGSVKSNEFLVDYYTEVQNGGFEDPQIEDEGSWTHQGTHYAFVKDQYVTGWKTTATDHMIEFGEYKGGAHNIQNQYPSDDVVDSKGNHTYGTQYVELNANYLSTLYQDVLTDGGSDLNWSLLHHCLPQDGTDTMYVVVMSTKEAEMLLADNSSNVYLKDTVGPYVLEHGTKDAKGAVTAEYPLMNSSESVTITLWTAETSKDDGWKRYEGAYQVPSGQYLTRLFFVSASGRNANGNLLEDVSFDQKVSYTIEYWVYNADSKEYELKASDTKTGRQFPGEKVTADISDYDAYTFVGSTQGAESGGKDPKSTKKDTAFTVSGDNNVMSLYFKEGADVSGSIKWDDSDNAFNTRPDTVTVQLLDKDGKPVKDDKGNAITTTAIVDDEGNYTYSFDDIDLPKYDEDGNEIEYTVTTKVDGYTTSVDDDGNITCTYNRVNGKVTWVDSDDADGVRPEQVTVDVYDKDGKKVGTATVTEDQDGNWIYNINDLPLVDENGDPIEYTYDVKVDGYTTSVDKDGNVTCTRATTVEGSFQWDDEDNKFNTRPKEITVELLDKDGKAVTDKDGNPITVTATADKDGNYTYSFDNVPKYDENGNVIEYTVGAVVNGYDVDVTKDDNGAFTINCKFHNGKDGQLFEMDPPVKKVITGDKPSSDATFEFVMVPEKDSYPLPTSLDGKPNHTEVTITGEGEEEFGYVQFKEAGTYVYHVSEVATNKSGYTYDTSVYEITFVVTENKETGDLEGTRTILKNGKGENLEICTFTNTYAKKSHHHDNDGTTNHGGYAKVDFYLVDDATSKPIPGAQVGLYTSAGKLVGVYTTDANGHVQFPNLKGGTYYFQQLTTVDGYALNTNKLNFKLDGTDMALMLTNKALAGTTAATDVNAAAGANGTGAGNGQGTGAGAAVGGATGDSSNMMLYGAAASVAAVLLAAWFVMNRKRANG